MKKTNIEKLMELREKGYELSKRPTQIALALKQTYADERAKIKSNPEHSPAKKAYLEEELAGKLGRELFTILAKDKADYKKTSSEAIQLAKTIQLTEHKAPADVLLVKEFERDLAALNTSTKLGINATRSIEAIDAMVGKYGDEPYFAEQIKNQFATLSDNVLAIEATPQLRQSLARVLDRVDSKATTDEQRAAVETLEFFGNGDVQMFRPDSIQYTNIRDIIGRDAAQYLNEPEQALEIIEQAE